MREKLVVAYRAVVEQNDLFCVLVCRRSPTCLVTSSWLAFFRKKKQLRPLHSYHVSLRAHDAAFTSTFWTGAVTWGRYSGTTPCTTGTGTAAAREHRHRTAAPQKMLVVRTSEHSGHTDYLAEHDSSDMMAASYLLTAMSMLEATKGDTVLEAYVGWFLRRCFQIVPYVCIYVYLYTAYPHLNALRARVCVCVSPCERVCVCVVLFIGSF